MGVAAGTINEALEGDATGRVISRLRIVAAGSKTGTPDRWGLLGCVVRRSDGSLNSQRRALTR